MKSTDPTTAEHQLFETIEANYPEPTVIHRCHWSVALNLREERRITLSAPFSNGENGMKYRRALPV